MISSNNGGRKKKVVYRISGGDHAGRRTPPFRVNCRHFPDSESMTNSCFDPVLVDEKIR
jgi:hypothetical protein